MIGELKKLQWFFKEKGKDYFIGISLLMLTNVIVVLFPWILGHAVDAIVKKSLTKETLIQYMLILFIVLVVEYILGYLWQYKIFKNAILIQKELVSIILRKLMKMKAPFYEKYNTGDLMARATTDIQEIQELMGYGVLTASDAIGFSLSILFAMCVVVSWKLTIVSILPLPLMALAVQYNGKWLHKRYNDYQSAFAEMNDKTLEQVTGVRVVRAYVMEKRISKLYEQTVEKVRQKQLLANILSGLFAPITGGVMVLSTTIAIGYGTFLILNQEISVGNLISFNLYLNYLVWPMFAIGEFINTAQRGTSSIKRVDEILSEKNTDDSIEKKPFQETIHQIHFDKYDFQYPTSPNLNLKKIHLHIQDGQTIGIVGQTGSGKTTLIRQLLKEYDYGNGELTINNHNIQTIAIEELASKIGYVSQDNILFSRTIRENITFGTDTDDHDKLMSAIRAADFEKDLFSLPLGLETLVGERGVAVSGGQKQRISIARALLKDPQLLILDDALSAVDAKTEHKIIENIRQNRKDKMTIITTHRLSAVEHADQIIVLEQGEIIEQGTHLELIRQGGWYSEQYTIQRLEDTKHVE